MNSLNIYELCTLLLDENVHQLVGDYYYQKICAIFCLALPLLFVVGSGLCAFLLLRSLWGILTGR